ncbi:MAG TPA: Rne/Rng family ribonuclease, partial [Beutenbergiaceae bacterium]|nr:Rne/Rng family ribonuclease [Beutenbergiaceae bacterium]
MSDNATTQDQNDQQGNEAGNDAEVASSPTTSRRRPRRATRPAMTPEERAAAEAREAAEQVPPQQQDTNAAQVAEPGPPAEPEAGIDVLAEFGVDRTAMDTAQRAPAEPRGELNLDIPERPRGEGVQPDEHGSGAVNTDDDRDEHGAGREPDPVLRAQDAEPASADQDEEASDDAAQEPAQAPRLPATALLFQAPDPVAARTSRRAGAPAGPPAVAGDQDTGESPDATGSGEKKDQDQDAADGAGRSGGRRRRRGGRGRRRGGQGGQGADSSAGSDAKDSSDGARGASGSGAGSDSQETSGSDGSGNDQRSGSGRSAKGGGKGAKGGSKDSNAGTKDAAKNDDSGHRTQSAESGESQDTEGQNGKDQNSKDQNSKDQNGQDQGDKDQNGNGGGESNGSSRRRRRRRSRGSRSGGSDDAGRNARDEVTALKGSTRLEAKRQRRRDGRDSQRRRSIITEAEFLARRESVNRSMVVREMDGRTQVAILEDDVLVEHYVARKSQASMVGNVYLGRVQNVLPSMEAAFIDVGKGRNAVLYAGEVNWDAAGLEGQPRRIEQALASGDSVLVQVTKDPVGHKGARLTSQITLAGRYLVLVPSGSMTGISRKLPDTERNRLKKLLKEIVPDGQGVIVRTAAEGASEDELRRDVERLTKQWAEIEKKTGRKSTNAPTLLKGEPELATRVVRDVFNEDFTSLTVSGGEAWKTISEYVGAVAPDLSERLQHWTADKDVFAEHRIDEQLAKGLDRKVWLPSGGSLVIDRTEAMTVVDVNTGKFTGSGGTLEETVTRNNLEAAEEIVRQLRLRDIGGIIVIDFIDMVLEANRD